MGTRKGQKNVTEEKFAVISLTEERVKQKEITVKFNLSKSAVSKIIKNFKIHGRNRNDKRGGKNQTM